MAVFKPGEKARIVNWHDVKKKFRGLECTMRTGLVTGIRNQSGYWVEIPGHPNIGGWFGTPDCFEKIHPERNQIVSWASLGLDFDPRKETTDAPAPAVPAAGDPVHGLLV